MLGIDEYGFTYVVGNTEYTDEFGNKIYPKPKYGSPEPICKDTKIVYPEFKIARSGDEVLERKSHLYYGICNAIISKHSRFELECKARLWVLRDMLNPEDVEKLHEHSPESIRYAALGESLWLHGLAYQPTSFDIYMAAL